MSTGDRIDGALSGGVAGLKKKMKELRERIAVENGKAEVWEKEYAETAEHLAQQVERIGDMKYKCEDLVEEIEKREKKLPDIEHRVREREEFVAKSLEAAGRVVIEEVDEDLIALKQKELEERQATYKQNAAALQEIEARKQELVTKSEESEATLAEYARTLHKLKIELEYNLIEEQRRSKTSKASVEMAFNTEKSCLDLQRGLDVIMKRKTEATRRLNEYELRIHKTEDAYEALNFERRRIEAAIREILLSSVRKL